MLKKQQLDAAQQEDEQEAMEAGTETVDEEQKEEQQENPNASTKTVEEMIAGLQSLKQPPQVVAVDIGFSRQKVNAVKPKPEVKKAIEAAKANAKKQLLADHGTLDSALERFLAAHHANQKVAINFFA